MNFEHFMLRDMLTIWNKRFSFYVMDDMMRYMEELPDNEVVEECINYWDDHFEDVVEEIKEYVDCKFKKPLDERFNNETHS